MRRSALHRAGVLLAGFAALAAPVLAEAQAPPYPPLPPGAAAPPPAASPEASEIAACLCLSRSLEALQADMTSRHNAYDAVRHELAQLDQELQRERAGMDVNNPQSVARFRQLLQRRDAAFRRSNGPEAGALNTAVQRYGAAVNDYNARCANRPRDPRLLAQVQATLACPAPY